MELLFSYLTKDTSDYGGSSHLCIFLMKKINQFPSNSYPNLYFTVRYNFIVKRQRNFVIKTLILDYELKSNLENFCHFVSAAKSN